MIKLDLARRIKSKSQPRADELLPPKAEDIPNRLTKGMVEKTNSSDELELSVLVCIHITVCCVFENIANCQMKESTTNQNSSYVNESLHFLSLKTETLSNITKFN